MKKRYAAVLFILLSALALLFFFRTDFRDTRGAALRKLEPFFDYSFNNNWRYEKEDIEKFSGIVDTKHSRYTIFYKDGQGKQREFSFDTTGGFAKEAVLWRIEEEMYQVFNESLADDIEKEFGFSARVSSKLTELKGEGGKGKKRKMEEYKNILLDETKGVKLYDVDEFFSRTAAEYFQVMEIEVSPQESEREEFIKHKETIRKKIAERIGKKLDLSLKISGKNISHN